MRSILPTQSEFDASHEVVHQHIGSVLLNRKLSEITDASDSRLSNYGQVGCNGLVQRMFNLLDYPLLILAVALPVFWLSASIGARLRDNARNPQPGDRDDLTFVLGGALTLLGLIVGFTFQMALNSYDRRKTLEVQEANAIGTEYARTDLLPPVDAVMVRALLKSYIDQRISNYNSRNEQRVQQVAAQTARLQTEMWSAVAASAAAQPSALTALVVSGMDNVLDSEGYVQAAWRHHIPVAAWGLLFLISIFCNLLIGRAAQGRGGFVFLILPVALSISLFLIAEIDSPRAGSIRVEPQNLQNLAHCIRSTRPDRPNPI